MANERMENSTRFKSKRAWRESLDSTLAYAFSDGWEDRVYRLDVRGSCNCEGHRPRRGCRHTAAFSRALNGWAETGAWESDVQFVVTPWGADDLGLTGARGLDVRPTP